MMIMADLRHGPKHWPSETVTTADHLWGPGGAAFARHCDNHCRSGAGPHCNGRGLSAVYYCNEAWRDAEGGCLRIFPPQGLGCDDDRNDENVSEDSSAEDGLCDVLPLSDRLVLFFSDFRCPHEVLPVRGERARFACTLWYMDASQKQQGSHEIFAQSHPAASPATFT